MKILITGRGTSGSFQIRGYQLGQAIGAHVEPKASSDGFDLTVLVKRPTPEVLDRLSGPIVWDVVDAWPQPAGNQWDKHQALTWLRDQVSRVKPVGIVAATEQMGLDCDFGIPVICLPHHGRRQELNPIRERVHVVGYEGAEPYLGRWRTVLERECKKRGWRFVINPDRLSDLDIVVALRDSDGYPARHWKSAVKLANAQITGTPCILSPESGYREMQSGAECWAENEAGLVASLDRLTDYRSRADASRVLLMAAPHLSTIASRYKAWLSSF